MMFVMEDTWKICEYMGHDIKMKHGDIECEDGQ
jgi:hypothetical protein